VSRNRTGEATSGGPVPTAADAADPMPDDPMPADPMPADPMPADPMRASPPALVKDAQRPGSSRRQILALLHDSDGALGVAELAERVGLHPNTVRFHLDRLVAEGLVLRRIQERTQPGRPRLSFTAAGSPTRRDRRSYRLLAEVLASFFTGAVPDAAAAATEAGVMWGRYLTARPAPYRRASEEEAVAELMRTLDEIGFAPELSAAPARAPAGAGREILLRHCPFLEVAEAHREVVCSVHLGLMQGALAEMRAPVTADRLTPFVEPSLCIAGLAGTGPGESSSGPPA
jgi:predicted ArsR family transcriptional regulator